MEQTKTKPLARTKAYGTYQERWAVVTCGDIVERGYVGHPVGIANYVSLRVDQGLLLPNPAVCSLQTPTVFPQREGLDGEWRMEASEYGPLC